MTRKSVGFLCTAALCAATMGISISSCDNNSNPATPGNNGRNNGKTPQVLDGPCVKTIGVSDCPAGGATVQYSDDGIVVEGLVNPDQDAVICDFSSPANIWNAFVNVGFPASGGELSYEAQDDDGNPEARLDISVKDGKYSIRPTFTSTPEGGNPAYDATILDNGVVVGTMANIDLTKAIVLTPDCTIPIKEINVGWRVYSFDAQCLWKIKLPKGCCKLSFQLPDGRILTGDQLDLKEVNENGVYVYRLTDKITTTGNTTSYTIKAASAMLSES